MSRGVSSQTIAAHRLMVSGSPSRRCRRNSRSDGPNGATRVLVDDASNLVTNDELSRRPRPAPRATGRDGLGLRAVSADGDTIRDQLPKPRHAIPADAEPLAGRLSGQPPPRRLVERADPLHLGASVNLAALESRHRSLSLACSNASSRSWYFAIRSASGCDKHTGLSS